MMTHHNYLIVGGGMAAKAAITEIRELDQTGSIGLISAEEGLPYDRPPLSKQLWFGRRQLEDIFYTLPGGVEIFSGRLARQLDAQQKHILDDQGNRFTYDKLLLATGSSPRRLPFGENSIIYFRTVSDYRRLRALSEKHERIAVIGGGFIGSEIAAALAMQGKKVTLVFPDEGIGTKVFPLDLSLFLNDYYREHQVEVLTGRTVTDVTGSGTDLALFLDDGSTIEANGVVAGIGVLPNVSLAEDAGLAVKNGILVNEYLQTSDQNIFAAGDIANYPDTLLGIRRRVEHEDAALSMGRTAGRGMTGSIEKYNYSPMFYSDMFDLGYEAIGELDSRLETVSDWKEPYRKGIVYYLKQDLLCGVLLWNIWDRVETARKLIADGASFAPNDLIGKMQD